MAKAAQYINRIIISTDSRELAGMVEHWGVEAPFVRPVELSGENIRADEVLSYSLDQLEQQSYYPDLVVPMEITYPFRPKGLPDTLIRTLLESGLFVGLTNRVFIGTSAGVREWVLSRDPPPQTTGSE